MTASSPSYDSEFLELSSQGLTRVQIAVRLGILSKDLLSYLSPGIADKGRELCQVFHEDLMSAMIRGDNKASTKEMDLQAWRLRTMFSDDWSDRHQEEDSSAVALLNDEELVKHIQDLVVKYKHLINV